MRVERKLILDYIARIMAASVNKLLFHTNKHVYSKAIHSLDGIGRPATGLQ